MHTYKSVHAINAICQVHFSVYLPQNSHCISSACVSTISIAPLRGTDSLFFNNLHLVHISADRTLVYVISNLKWKIIPSVFRPDYDDSVVLFWMTDENVEGTVASWFVRSSPNLSGYGSSPGRRLCVVFSGKTLHS